MHEQVRKSSTWTPASTQKKSKSVYGQRSFSIQPKRENKSSVQQELPTYSTEAADRLAANVMRSMETQQQEQFDASSVQRQPNLGGTFVIQRFEAEDATRSTLSPEVVQGLSDADLQESFRVVENHRQTLNPNDPTFMAVRENLFTIRSELARRDISRAGDDATHQAVVAQLVEFTRQQLDIYPTQVQQFVQQATPNTEEKVRVLGEVAAAVARMEFLLGTIYHKGQTWESPSNRGHMVDRYTGLSGNQSSYPWCSRFATTVLAMVTGRNSLRARSGYQIANPSQFGLDLNYDSGAGGAFTGTHSSRNASTNPSSSGNYNPWAELRQTLQRIDNGTITDKTKEEAVDEFLSNHTRPQPGDIMIVRRGTAQANSFTQDNPATPASEAFQSHTTMIEQLDGYVLHTIEGNREDRVTGRTLDLTNPDDVEEIVFISRPSLTSFTASQGSTQGTTTGGAAAIEITEDQLLQPIRHINQLLETIAAEQGYVQNIGAGQNNTVANLVTQNNGGNSTE